MQCCTKARLLALIITGVAGTAACAQTKPANVQTVGPWEVVQWANGGMVSRCTVIRDQKPAGTLDFGLLTDREGVLLSVSTKAWSLTPDAPVAVMLTPRGAPTRSLQAAPVSAERANVSLGESDLLNALQRETPLDVAIGGVKVTLLFDDFNAARIVFESCVLNLGKKLRRAR
jgi:hypothetical protein